MYPPVVFAFSPLLCSSLQPLPSFVFAHTYCRTKWITATQLLTIVYILHNKNIFNLCSPVFYYFATKKNFDQKFCSSFNVIDFENWKLANNYFYAGKFSNCFNFGEMTLKFKNKRTNWLPT